MKIQWVLLIIVALGVAPRGADLFAHQSVEHDLSELSEHSMAQRARNIGVITFSVGMGIFTVGGAWLIAEAVSPTPNEELIAPDAPKIVAGVVAAAGLMTWIVGAVRWANGERLMEQAHDGLVLSSTGDDAVTVVFEGTAIALFY